MASDLGSYDADTFSGELEHEVERLRMQVEVGWPKESRTLRWFGLRDGMAVLEVGSGPGFVTEHLLKLLPASEITAVEIDARLIELARVRLQAVEARRIHYVHASVLETGLPDDSFDFCVARFLFRHLHDPLGAAREIRRVLKPSGKIVVIDADGRLSITEPPQEPASALLKQKRTEARRQHGEDFAIGRRLLRLLRAAGFDHLDIEAVVRSSDIVGVDTMLRISPSSRLQPLVSAGSLSEEEADRGLAALERWRANPDALLVNIGLLVYGEKA